MKERINRQDDENFYQPKIHSDRIRELYQLSQETHLPMTVLVDYAIRSYYNVFQEEKRKEQEARENAEWRIENEATSDNLDNQFFGEYEPDDLYDL
jgi:hypothetical protein